MINLNRIAAPFAALLLILLAVSILIGSVSHGHEVILPVIVTDCHSPTEHHSLTVVVAGKADGTARINASPGVDLATLRKKLHEIFRTRTEKLVFVRAEANLTWQQFMTLVDHIPREIRKVVLLTPGLSGYSRYDPCHRLVLRSLMGSPGPLPELPIGRPEPWWDRTLDLIVR
jgi:biopolymer transport protein ExbD